MIKEKPVEFDYEKFLLGDPIRSRNYDVVFNIVNGHINEARYRIKHNDFKESVKTLDYADIRIEIFSEDAKESGATLNWEVDYLYVLVENVRRDVDKAREQIS